MTTKKITRKSFNNEEPVVKAPSLEDDQVYIHNTSKGEFHVPLKNYKNPEEEPIIFTLNEVLKMEKAYTKETRFINAIEKGMLEVFTAEEYAEHLRAEKARKSESARKILKGNYRSGLPNNKNLAVSQISVMTDADELSAILEDEDRPSIMAAIEERIEQLTDENYSSDRVTDSAGWSISE